MPRKTAKPTPKRTDPLDPAVFSEINDLAFDGPIYGTSMWYSPKAWDGASGAPKRKWSALDFPPDDLTPIPRNPGVYLFFVAPDVFGLPQASGLLYVGKATSLRSRISYYLGQIDSSFTKTDRPYVWRMVNVWHGHLRWYYTVTTNVTEAKSLEDEMLAALRPPANKSYPASISRRQRAF